jgi:putative Holliday junction resolvase
VGLPSRNGSIRIFAPPISIPKAEWPYQVSFIVSSSLWLREEDRTSTGHVKGEVRNVSVVTIEELAGMLERGCAIAGLDLGTKTIGVAVSDRSLGFANPRAVIGRKKFTVDAQTLLETAARENIAAFVIGLPVNMDGSEGPRAQSTRAFVRNMERLTDLPFVFWDERLSTVAAERALLEMDVSRRKRGERIDSAAAAFILQGALDRLHALSRDHSAGGD